MMQLPPLYSYRMLAQSHKNMGVTTRYLLAQTEDGVLIKRRQEYILRIPSEFSLNTHLIAHPLCFQIFQLAHPKDARHQSYPCTNPSLTCAMGNLESWLPLDPPTNKPCCYAVIRYCFIQRDELRCARYHHVHLDRYSPTIILFWRFLVWLRISTKSEWPDHSACTPGGWPHIFQVCKYLCHYNQYISNLDRQFGWKLVC